MSTHNLDVSPEQLEKVAGLTEYAMIDDRGIAPGDSLNFRAVVDCETCSGTGEVFSEGEDSGILDCKACDGLGRRYPGTFQVMAIAEAHEPDGDGKRLFKLTPTVRGLTPAEQLEKAGDHAGAAEARKHEEMQRRGERVGGDPKPLGEREEDEETEGDSD